MIELKNINQFQNAIARAKAERENLIVRWAKVNRKYFVTNRKNGNTYEINFKVSPLGKRYGHCTCRAGQMGMGCKHLMCACSLHMWLAEQGVFKRENQISQ